jgi:hypothetical protein
LPATSFQKYAQKMNRRIETIPSETIRALGADPGREMSGSSRTSWNGP